MSTTLAECKVGDIVYLKQIHDKQLAIQLYNLGCVLEEEIMVERKTLFGDPILISVDDNFISLRKEDAKNMEVILK